MIGSELLQRTYDKMYYRNVALWFYHLKELDWETKIQYIRSEIGQTFSATERIDIQVIGFITRNSISAQFHRLLTSSRETW